GETVVDHHLRERSHLQMPRRSSLSDETGRAGCQSVDGDRDNAATVLQLVINRYRVKNIPAGAVDVDVQVSVDTGQLGEEVSSRNAEKPYLIVNAAQGRIFPLLVLDPPPLR